MKTIDGFTYSKTPFEEWKFKAKCKILFNSLSVENIDVYTNCENKWEVESSINLLTKYDMVSLKIVNWISKEEDEWANKFIEETLKNL